MSVKLDTNGFKPEMIETLLSSALIDTVAVDLKGPWSKYPELTGMKCSEEQARSCLSSLLELAHKQPDAFYFRCTWVPQLTQSDIDETRSYLPPDWILHLQDYVPPVKKSQSEPSRELEDAG
jgi:pyruvate formate lyase activating enzyme